MKLLRRIAEVRAWREQERSARKKVGFVPTMGYFHDGHLSLMRYARKEVDTLAISIYVNPLQFGPQEDFAAYPRDLERDLRLAEEVGVDMVFAPSDEEMYPPGFQTLVRVLHLQRPLCGWSRPGHFDGVTTVVTKLFHIVEPELAYFGQKDYQQAQILRRMTRDLNFPVEIRILPTVREKDGLAMSSRNTYLNAEERQLAPELYRALQMAEDAFTRGERNAERLRALVRAHLDRFPAFRIDYVEVVHPETLEPLAHIEEGAVVAVAAYLGRARLIDNLLLGEAKRQLACESPSFG